MKIIATVLVALVLAMPAVAQEKPVRVALTNTTLSSGQVAKGLSTCGATLTLNASNADYLLEAQQLFRNRHNFSFTLYSSTGDLLFHTETVLEKSAYTPEGLAEWKTYESKLERLRYGWGYSGILIYLEADATVSKLSPWGEKTIQRGRCYKVTIRWTQGLLVGKAHHVIGIAEGGEIIDPGSADFAFKTFEEYESSFSTIRMIIEIVKT